MSDRADHFQRICVALAHRAPGGEAEVARLGAPLGPRALHQWMTAGLLTGREAAELRALPPGAPLELIRAALSGDDASQSLQEWSWGPLDEDHTVPEGQPPPLAEDPPLEDSWSWNDSAYASVAILTTPQPFAEGPRFQLGPAIAETRFFTVHAARDRLMGRDLLVHRHRPDAPLGAHGFVAAVRRQARLQHPIIQPIYELALDGPAPFYATAAVRDHTLHELIKGLKRAAPDAPLVEPVALPRLLESVLDVARALTFAHRHGVVHRDLRPRHVRLGRYGEVQLGGWFRARRLTDPRHQGAGLNVVNGGLGYLAPERLGEGLPACEAPADVWGLGALLYAVLARRPPFAGKSSTEVLAKMRAETLAPLGARADVPAALASLCERALVVDPALRLLTADAFAAELEDYLEGTRAEARRLEAVDAQLARAHEAARRHQTARGRLRQAHIQAARARDPAAPAETAAARARADTLRGDAERWFFEADAEFEAALALLPGYELARHGLAVVHHRALEDATLGLVELPVGPLRARLTSLASATEPAPPALAQLIVQAADGAHLAVALDAITLADGVRRVDPAAPMGMTPTPLTEVRPGLWRVRLLADGAPVCQTVVRLAPGEAQTVTLDPQPPPAGFVRIPAGHFAVGDAGPRAWQAHALPAGRSYLPDFLIGRHPVTLGALLPFLNAAAAEDPAAAADCAPRPFLAEGPLWRPGPDGRYALPFTDAAGHRWTADHPAVGLTPAAVEAYIAWRSARDGRRYALPTELQWAKAARGVEGDRYPWGDRAEPSFCHALDGRPQCHPVGHAPEDESVFGVADTAGTAREYTRGVHGDLVLRGGSWLLPFCECDLTVRAALLATCPLNAVGFRLVLADDDGFSEINPFPEAPPPPAPTPYEPPGHTLIGQMTEDLTVGGNTVLAIASPDDSADHTGPLGFDHGPGRYVIKEEIARGSMGRVSLAWDEVLQRPVALKILHDRHAEELLSRYRFIMEARITGRLQHPAILPVYDMGVLPGGQRFFTMKPVEGLSLGDVLKGKAAGDRRLAAEFGRDRLVTVMRRVCQAVAFAHAHKVVHRDLKPANVLIGDLGEVLLVDFGLARQLDPDPSDLVDVPETAVLAKADGRVTRVGSVIGTPFYMSPEQAMGLQEIVGPPSDIYGLGALLYHVLAQRPPFTGRQINEVLRKVRRGNPEPPSRAAPDLDVPEALDLVVMQALAMEAEGRQASAQAVAEALANWQDQSRLAAREAAWWADRADRAADAVRGFEQAQAQLDQERARVTSLRAELKHSPAPARRQALRAAQDRAQALTVGVEAQVAQVVRRSRRALDAGRPEVRGRLLRVLRTRYLHAERDRDAASLRWSRRLLESFDDDGQVSRWMRQGAPLRVRTAPAGLMARVLREPLEGGAPETVHRGHTPVELANVPAGAGVVRLGDRRAEVRVPFLVRRGQPVDLDVAWPDDPRRDFVWVPGGRFRYGGDPVADDGMPARGARLPNFKMAVFPVTCGEWQHYLDALHAVDPAQAHARTPRLRLGGPALWGPVGTAIFGPFDPDHPVTGVTLADAHAYAQWRAREERVRYRLPTSAEWEKAARGVDGRPMPWGDAPMPEDAVPPFGLHPVGRVAADVSPYGMREIVSGVFEWTLTAARNDAAACYVRGGCSALPLQGDPCARRLTWDPTRPSPLIGLRLVIDP